MCLCHNFLVATFYLLLLPDVGIILCCACMSLTSGYLHLHVPWRLTSSYPRSEVFCSQHYAFTAYKEINLHLVEMTLVIWVRNGLRQNETCECLVNNFIPLHNKQINWRHKNMLEMIITFSLHTMKLLIQCFKQSSLNTAQMFCINTDKNFSSQRCYKCCLNSDQWCL